MTGPARPLDEASRRTLELIAEAASANPFEPRRYELDAELVNTSVARARPQSGAREAVALELLGVVDGALYDALEARGARIEQLAPGERELLTYAAIFAGFLRYATSLTDHAMAQLERPDSQRAVACAKDALERFRRYGFDAEQSARLFGLIYQIARAYHFISTALPGESASMQALRARLWRNVFTHDLRLYELHLWNRLEDFSTFLLGETGSGKGTAARALGLSGFIPYLETGNHFAGDLSRLCLPINLSQFTESLIESELFGHEKGAFTGAIRHHDGAFARCPRHGTIFLDEIGEVSIPIQIKLLNVLQDREFTPVGSHKPRRFEGRVIAATNQPIEQLRRGGAFRDDFFYRLCSDVIVMPSLRERLRDDPDELRLLLEHIITRIAGAQMPELVERIGERLRRGGALEYAWPGNVRELEQGVRHVLITGDYAPIAASADRRDWSAALAERLSRGELSASALLGLYATLLYDQLGSYEAVGERLELDRRTVRKHITAHKEQ